MATITATAAITITITEARWALRPLHIGRVVDVVAMAKLNVRDAIAAHVAWKVKLLQFLDGKGDALDAKKVACDDCCALGQWIYGDGAQLVADPAFPELKQKHAAFHRRAGMVVTGGAARGRALLDATYDALSSDVVAALVHLKPKLG